MKNEGCLTCEYRGKWFGFSPFGKYWNRKTLLHCNKCNTLHHVIKTRCKDWKKGEAVKKFHWVFVSATTCALPDRRKKDIVNLLHAFTTTQTVILHSEVFETFDIYTVCERYTDAVYNRRDEIEKWFKKKKKNFLGIDVKYSIESCDGFETEEECRIDLERAIQGHKSRWEIL